MRRNPTLDWFFVEAPMLLGAPAMSLEPSSRSVGLAPQGLPEHVVDNATTYRQIAEVVERLGHMHQMVLRRYYTPLPPALRRIYSDLGDLAGVILIEVDAGELASLVVHARKDKDARARLVTLKADARKAVDAAHEAYRSKRREYVTAEHAARRARLDAMLKGCS